MNYQGKNIVIVGLGVTGISCVDYFLSCGVVPRIIDTRSLSFDQINLSRGIECHFGSLRRDWLESADIIVVSPGMMLPDSVKKMAAGKGIEIIGDTELFCREINHRKNKIVAITGTNGKTTVSTLVGQIGLAAGIKTAVGGNIGIPVLSLLQESYALYVLELSSFQLETLNSLKATVATILNISEDHMDRYPLGIKQYAAVKQRIYDNADHCIINNDDPLTFPKRGHCLSCIGCGVLLGEYSLDAQYSHLLVNNKPVLATADIKLIGLHNYVNCLFALAIADRLSIDRMTSLSVIRQFKALPHRFELISRHHGVQWIDDSKATNVGSTVVALKSVICEGHLYLLLGGVAKGSDFSPLLPYLQQDNLSIYAFGRDANILARLRPQITTVTNTMAEAITLIAPKTVTGDVVLLSPACASTDQFKSYIERGQLFKTLTEAWVL